MQRARRPQHVHAVAAAHLEVAQHDVEVAVVQPLDGGVAVRRLFDFVSGLGQAADQPAAQRVVIVGDENSTHRSLTAWYLDLAPCATRRLTYRSQPYLNHADALVTGSVTRKRVPVSGAAADVDAPVVRVDDLPDDRQPEPGPCDLGREERIEDLDRSAPAARPARRRRRRRPPPASAGATPANAGSASIALVDRRDRDAPPAVERLERVGQQVREHLRELMMIAVDHRQLRLRRRSSRPPRRAAPSTRPS